MKKKRIVTDEDGTKYYYLGDELHREDGPAIIWEDGSIEQWFLNNKRHREGGPALEFKIGDCYWYQNDRLHREDGPAIIYGDGTKEWYLYDFLIEKHRYKSTVNYLKNSEHEWCRDGLCTRLKCKKCNLYAKLAHSIKLAFKFDSTFSCKENRMKSLLM